jgi:hypothetical protein
VGTGIVVPAKSKIIPDRGVAFSWTAAGVRIAGKVQTQSGGIQLDAESLDVCQRARIIATGLVDISTVERVDLEAKAKIRAKLYTLDIESSTGAIDVASNALLLAAGSLSIVADNGITAGSNVKFKANGVKVDAVLDAGNGPLTAGDKLMVSGGRIEMSAGGDIVAGERAKIRTRKILATDVSLTSVGGSILFGPNLKLTADRDLTVTADGAVAFAEKSRCGADEGTLSVTTPIGFWTS